MLTQKAVKWQNDRDFVRSVVGDLRCSVRVGDKVSPDTTLFEGDQTVILQTLDVARDLKLPPREVRGYVECADGEIVSSGDVIAGRGVASGVARLVSQVKADGRISLTRLDYGLVDVMSPFTEAVLTAGVNGTVKKVVPAAGIDREIVLGVDGLSASPFRILPYLRRSISGVSAPVGFIKDGNSVYRAADCVPGLAGHIVVAGRCLTVSLYRALVEVGAVGIICGGIPVEEAEVLGMTSVPVYVAEGWGTIPINAVLFNCLVKSKGKLVFMNLLDDSLVIPWARGGGFTSQKEEAVSVGSLENGDMVQVRDFPYWGYSGEVVGVLEEEGLCVVKLSGSGQKVSVGGASVVRI